MLHKFVRVLCVLMFWGFWGGLSQCYAETNGGQAMNIELKSAAFQEGAMIPKVYTCDGQNISPPLSWSGIPAQTKSIALIMDDPDATRGTWVHWVLFNIPPDTKGLPEKTPLSASLANGARHGVNSWPKLGYGGPCPPSGIHRYYFKIYALDLVLPQQPGMTKAQLLKAMEGHILAQGRLMGKYTRK
ncbi:MAG: YbhB/YbcL family Raf kinase inhibitor-like protein [Desulfomonilaceae bacterium]